MGDGWGASGSTWMTAGVASLCRPALWHATCGGNALSQLVWPSWLTIPLVKSLPTGLGLGSQAFGAYCVPGRSLVGVNLRTLSPSS